MKLVGVPKAQIVTGRDWTDLAFARADTEWAYWALGVMFWRAESPHRSILKGDRITRPIVLQWNIVERSDHA